MTPSPWPAGATFGDEGLAIGGLRARDLAERFGTPLLVVDEADVRARFRRFRDAFGDVLFAVKAFPAREIARAALDEGLGLLAATGGEVELCLAAGAPGERIVLHGNNKSDDELRLAVDAAVRFVVVDNHDELERLDEAARRGGRSQPVLIRVVPAVDPHTHAYVDTGGRDTKFGIPIEDGLALDASKRAAAAPGVDLRGLHLHIGSQVLDAAPYLAAVDAAMTLAGEASRSLGVSLATLDVGGGFGVTYTDETAPAPAELDAAIRERVAEGARRAGISPPALVVEPGRAPVANPVVTLYRVGAIKHVPGVRTYLAVDGGMSDNIRPALYGSTHSFALASRQGERSRSAFTVVGKHCESGDVLGRDVTLPADVERGDLLAVAGTGAYAYSMASTYNRVGRPAVVSVRNGSARLVLRREDTADLDRLEVGRVPEYASSPSPPPDGVVVRPARPADAASFLELWRAVVAEGRYVRTERVDRGVREQRRRFRNAWTDGGAHLVAVADGAVVGVVSLTREPHPVNRHVASLGIAVAAAHRGRGIGSALMHEAIRWANEVGVEKLTLSVYPGNRAAMRLYARFGFAQEGRLSGHSRKARGDVDEIVMGAWLVGPAR